ncbi:inositol monophosphatase family protein [Salinarimonas soli]|uniref:3'(2'),5'-bisphosphate nucleotidase CysQ n=1 Tax=Salinarimonas soli TaxID=1638099 RepID=A0A5B2VBA0_9HYPH|nr:3'(2'),5'-bisphosphate nucleotidase CysQ [Salinarimonas soli]KAA2236244.1 3'(2'),5'-bisphosphate nucleotidase CysQ [Salinarimonas soli]
MPHREITGPLVPLLREVAQEAGDMARRYFRPGQKTAARIWSKAGGSPVTEADVQVDAFLKVRLSRALPDAGWLSEETADHPGRLDRRLVWIVDPIDGTRAFLNGHQDWSVAIGLLLDGEPVLGVVYGPALNAYYEAVAGEGATLNGQPISVSPREGLAGAVTAGPVPLIDQLAGQVGEVRRAEKIPSLALRLARVADGSVDLGLVSANARDWDIAGADLILREAGGRLSAFDGTAPRYNRPDPVHREMLASSLRLHGPLVEALTRRVQAAH